MDDLKQRVEENIEMLDQQIKFAEQDHALLLRKVEELKLQLMSLQRPTDVFKSSDVEIDLHRSLSLTDLTEDDSITAKILELLPGRVKRKLQDAMSAKMTIRVGALLGELQLDLKKRTAIAIADEKKALKKHCDLRQKCDEWRRRGIVLEKARKSEEETVSGKS